MLCDFDGGGGGVQAKFCAYIPGRNGKQCRERWLNHLNPNLKKGSVNTLLMILTASFSTDDSDDDDDDGDDVYLLLAVRGRKRNWIRWLSSNACTATRGPKLLSICQGKKWQ